MYFSGNIQVTRAIHGLVIPHNTHKLSISSISSSSRTAPSARSKFSSSSRAKGSARSNSIISSFEQGSPVRCSTRLESHLCEALLWSYLATHVISAQFTSLTDLDVHGFRCIIPLNNFFHSILSRLSWRAVNITAMKATSHLKIEISICWRVLAFRNIQHIPNARRLTRNNTMERRRKMCYRDIRPDNCNLWSFKIRQGSRDMFHFLWTIDHSLHSYFWWRVTNEVNRTGYSTDDGLTLIRQGFGGEKGKIYHGC